MAISILSSSGFQVNTVGGVASRSEPKIVRELLPRLRWELKWKDASVFRDRDLPIPSQDVVVYALNGEVKKATACLVTAQLCFEYRVEEGRLGQRLKSWIAGKEGDTQSLRRNSESLGQPSKKFEIDTQNRSGLKGSMMTGRMHLDTKSDQLAACWQSQTILEPTLLTMLSKFAEADLAIRGWWVPCHGHDDPTVFIRQIRSDGENVFLSMGWNEELEEWELQGYAKSSRDARTVVDLLKIFETTTFVHVAVR